MNATMTITPDENVDYSRRVVIDGNKITEKTFSTKDGILIYDVVEKEEKTINVNSVSLYDHRLIVEGVRYRILHMLSK